MSESHGWCVGVSLGFVSVVCVPQLPKEAEKLEINNIMFRRSRASHGLASSTVVLRLIASGPIRWLQKDHTTILE